jgi:Trypsin-like peptidase domain/Tetratricopeptide repeat/TPR repeat
VEAIAEAVKKRAHAWAMSAWLLFGGSALAAEKVPVDRLMASTVCVVGEVPGGSFESSGFVVGAGDTVMTTAHEIGAATNLRIKLRDGRVFRAQLDRLGNKNADIALLGLTGLKLPPVKFGTLQDVHTGDAVVTIGCPLGFDFSVTSGVVSSIRASDLGYPLIQTDVPVNPGSSGGPLFDSRGRVVGIIKSTAAGRERIHFALPADLGSALVEQVAHERAAYDAFNRAVVESVPEKKLTLYRTAVELDPALPEAHYNLALTLEKLGQLSPAEAEYRQTLQLRPGYSPAALNLGAMLYGAMRYREAIDVYREALPHDPRSDALRNNLAEAYRASGDRDGARREFEALLRQNPGYAPAHYGLAVLYDDDHGDRRRAADHYRRYLALAPHAADADQVRQWLRQAEQADKKQ